MIENLRGNKEYNMIIKITILIKCINTEQMSTQKVLQHDFMIKLTTLTSI